MATGAAQMRAVRYHRYGSPDVLAVERVPVPEPRKGEVLVKVFGTSVNPAEALVRAGKFRLMSGFRFPKGIGEDFTGQVVATGPGTSSALRDARVWGTQIGLNSATTAEYIRVKESLVAPAPTGHDLVELAALPTVALTARLALRLVGLSEGDRLLIVGAAGGVGTSAIQLARAAGAIVTTLSGAANTELCRKLGAETALDYTRRPTGLAFDAIVDLYGAGLGGYRRLLAKDGRMATMAAKGLGYVLASRIRPGPSIRNGQTRATRDELDALAAHVERGELRPVIDTIYPMERITDAHRSVETGHSRGKRVIRVA
ncbi:MAG TPA: NAD(P)-dependent alcohol dehydrogenase [Streptomyces sp.]